MTRDFLWFVLRVLGKTVFVFVALYLFLILAVLIFGHTPPGG
jgi:hypothetical protein